MTKLRLLYIGLIIGDVFCVVRELFLYSCQLFAHTDQGFYFCYYARIPDELWVFWSLEQSTWECLTAASQTEVHCPCVRGAAL